MLLMPLETTPGFFVGVALTLVGGVFLLVMLARAGGMAFGFTALSNLVEFLHDPNRRRARRLLMAALLTTIMGSMVTCLSVMEGDARRNDRCREACNQAGWEGGRFRGDPHHPPQQDIVYSCWCQSEDEWASEPVSLPNQP